jgi:DNA-binding transcriptional regulator YhcF (GntR family)
MEVFELEKKSGIPIYKQIVLTIEEAIVSGELRKGDKLPSLNAIKNKNNLSRDTVLNAFNELKNRGVIKSTVGKGYYVATEDIVVKKKIFLLFDEFNSFKEDLYNSFVSALGENIQVDIFFHHFNMRVFRRLINDNLGSYNAYAIMPANLKESSLAIQSLGKEPVYILDQMHPDLQQYPGVFQNFEKDMYQGLTAGVSQIKAYSKIVMQYDAAVQPQGFLKGMALFCEDQDMDYEVISDLNDRKPTKGELYLVLDDKNLIRIIKKILEVGLDLLKDIGIISYNETLLKEIVQGGITTISTDFKLMGENLATMILENKKEHIENPSSLILRKSL